MAQIGRYPSCGDSDHKRKSSARCKFYAASATTEGGKKERFRHCACITKSETPPAKWKEAT
eukprot:11965856-Ditylum_brightwellii.AAC.1